MNKNNINSNTQGEHYIIRSSVKPENVVLASNNNAILKISKEINFLYNLIQYAIKSQEKIFFLILSEDPLLDIENLKQYLMEKELTEFAKKEIIKISEIINNAILLQSEYDKIPRPKYFTEYNFTAKNGAGARGAVNGSLFYIIITKNGILQADKNSFRNECENLPYFYMLETYKILNTFSELINLLKPNQTPLDINIKTGSENEDEDKPKLHNNIFKDNAFELFEKYHSKKCLAENNKTELSLLYQLFKNDKLFLDTVELKHYIHWLNKTYGYSLIELRKTNINSKPNILRTNDYKEYKETTLKQP